MVGGLIVVLIIPLTSLFLSWIFPRTKTGKYLGDLAFERLAERQKRKKDDDLFFTNMVEESKYRIRPFESHYMEKE